MKKFFLFMVTAMLTLGLFAGTSFANDLSTKTIIDCSGAEVEIPSEISRVVVTSPSAVAFMVAMNLDDLLVGTHGSVLNHTWANVFCEGIEDLELFGKNPNAEELIVSDVDLVIIKDAAYAEELRNSGIPTVCFAYKNQEELYKAIDMLGDIFGDNAKEYASAWKAKLETTIRNITDDLSDVSEEDRRSVYYIDATGAEATSETLYLTAGGKSFVEYWINTSGADLVTSGFEGIEQIDQETALTLNPDTIFICGWLEYAMKDVLMSDELWQDVPAVKSNQVFLMPTSFVSYDRFAVELPLMLDYTANKLYPEQHEFGGIDSLREFYETFYNRSFNDDQLNNMLNGLNPDGTEMGEIREKE